jgi:hypothetical protein
MDADFALCQRAPGPHRHGRTVGGPLLALQNPPDSTCVAMFPPSVLHALRLMPVRFVAATRVLHVAVSVGVDYTVLAAIDQVLNCRTVPGLVSDRTMQSLLELAPGLGAATLHVFDRTSGSAEMARITGSYIARVGAEEVRIVRCGPYGWVRLRTDSKVSDLLFTLADVREAARLTFRTLPTSSTRRRDASCTLLLAVDAGQLPAIKRIVGEFLGQIAEERASLVAVVIA